MGTLGTRSGAPVLRGGTTTALGTALAGACPLPLAVASLLLGTEEVDLGRAGELVQELGVCDLACWTVDAALGVAVTAVRGAGRARLAASRRRRETGEPGCLCDRRERWLTLDRGWVSFWAGIRAGAVTGRGTGVVGVEGLGHLKDGSGHTGLLG